MPRKKTRKTSGDHGAAFVIGSLIGGLTGAVIALWKTPQSGAELRHRVTGPLGLKPHEPEPPVMPFITPITNEPIPESDSASPPAAGTVS